MVASTQLLQRSIIAVDDALSLRMHCGKDSGVRAFDGLKPAARVTAGSRPNLGRFMVSKSACRTVRRLRTLIVSRLCCSGCQGTQYSMRCQSFNTGSFHIVGHSSFILEE